VTEIFDLFSQKLGDMTGRAYWTYLPILKFIGIFIFEIFDHKVQISLRVILMFAPKNEPDTTTQY